jgi:uncharacterized membrane protein
MLSVWRFETADGAERASETIEDLSKEGLIRVHDAATVTWPTGAKKPKTRQLSNLTGAGALGGAFWGLLFGLLFFAPLLGMAIGAAAGAFSGSLADVGINNDFIAKVRSEVTPGTSALFLLTSDAVRDKVIEAFAEHRPQLIQTNLSQAQEDQLREAFAE